MAKKKITSSQVAEKAGVSQATVSMILNRRNNVSFSAETVEKVEQAARELGYEFARRSKHKDNKKRKADRGVLPYPYQSLLCFASAGESRQWPMKRDTAFLLQHTERRGAGRKISAHDPHVCSLRYHLYLNPHPDFQKGRGDSQGDSSCYYQQ